MVRGDGDASQDDGEDEDTNTSDEGLPLTGHLLGVKGSQVQILSARPRNPSWIQHIHRKVSVPETGHPKSHPKFTLKNHPQPVAHVADVAETQGRGRTTSSGFNTTNKKRNTRMHMRLGPNTSRGANTPPHGGSP